MPGAFPCFAEFLDQVRSHRARCGPVARRLSGDGLTPVSAFARLATSPSPAFLFESVMSGEKMGRYSFIGMDPFLWFEAKGPRMIISSAQGVQHGFETADPLRVLERWVGIHAAFPLPGLPSFLGGAVGFAGYDTVRYVERLPHPPPDDRNLPDLAFGLYDQILVFDHIRKLMVVAVVARPRGLIEAAADPQATTERLERGEPPGMSSDSEWLEAYDRARDRLDRLIARLGASTPIDLGLTDLDLTPTPDPPYESNFDQAGYEAVVARCQDYIRAGDIFQVVPSQRFRLITECRSFDIYRALRVVNPSPFLFYLDHGSYQLIGSSPEIMMRVHQGRMTMRPLAGTRRRGATEEEDRRLERELLADPKERAEHVMLIDLGRNDVGRVARPATVRLDNVMHVERYSHVMHLSTDVYGELAEGLTAFDALRVSLPVGTVSGAPKIRAMEIIDELEPTRRGPYAGAVGYIDFNGDMDTCIALRTIVRHGRYADVQAGAGVVYDSDPTAEYQETLAKARGLFQAIKLAESFRVSSSPTATGASGDPTT